MRNPTNTASPLPDTSDDRPKPRKLPRRPPPPPAAGGRRAARPGRAPQNRRPRDNRARTGLNRPSRAYTAGRETPYCTPPAGPGCRAPSPLPRWRPPAPHLSGRSADTAAAAAQRGNQPRLPGNRRARPRRALIGGRRRRAEAGTALPSDGAAGARPYLRAPGRGSLRGPPRSCAPARPRRRRRRQLAPRPLTAASPGRH